MADPNPYAPPAGEAEPPRSALERTALVVLAADAGRSLLWRGVTGMAMAFPGSLPSFVGSGELNIVIQLGGGAIIWRALPPSTARRLALAAVGGYGVRLVAQIAGTTRYYPALEGAVRVVDAAAIAAFAWGLDRWTPRAQPFAIAYLLASLASAAITVAGDTFPRELRSFLSVFFIALAIFALVETRKLRRPRDG